MRGMKKGLGTGVVMVTTMATILEAEEVVQGVGEVDDPVQEGFLILLPALPSES